MAKARKKTYRQACERDLGNGNTSSFSKGCSKRFPELAGGKKFASAKRPARAKVPEVCNRLLSTEMKKGNRKGAMRAYWGCRLEHAED